MTNLEQLIKLCEHCPSIKLIPAKALYNTRSEQIIIDINAAYCKARVALQGAQPLAFKVANDDLLWLSPHAIFNDSSAIRGGIPLCLPWFGVNQRDPKQAKHGFARNNDWQLIKAAETAANIQLTFSFEHRANATFPFSFKCEIQWQFGDNLQATFDVYNLSPEVMPFSFALHTYFSVIDKHLARVSGLAKNDYLDNTLGLKRMTQAEDVCFSEEVDRVYENTLLPLQLNTQTSKVLVNANNMPTAIIWNPDTSALNNVDIQCAYTQFICVERGAAFADELQLQPKESYRAVMSVTRI